MATTMMINYITYGAGVGALAPIITTINRTAIITTINRIAIITTINKIAIVTTINRIAIITTPEVEQIAVLLDLARHLSRTTLWLLAQL